MPNAQNTPNNMPQNQGSVSNAQAPRPTPVASSTPPPVANTMNTPPVPPQAPMPKKRGGMWKWLVTAIILLALLAGGAYAYMMYGSSDGNSSAPIAVVNGEEIPRSELETVRAQQTLAENGAPTTVTDEQIVDALVSRTLVLQKAREEGIAATEAEVDQQVAQAKTQLGGEEAYQAAIVQQGTTQAEARINFANQITIQKYLASKVPLDSVTVSDEELQAEYDRLVVGQEDAPEIATVREQIRAFLVQQKQQQLINQFVLQLRSEADIEVLL